MKKKMITLLIAAIMMALSAAPVFSYAGTDGCIARVSDSFTKEWEKCVYGDNGKSKMIYGYDKTLINEDYVRGYHSSSVHKVGINSHYSKYKPAGVVAKKTRIHTSKFVIYAVLY